MKGRPGQAIPVQVGDVRIDPVGAGLHVPPLDQAVEDRHGIDDPEVLRHVGNGEIPLFVATRTPNGLETGVGEEAGDRTGDHAGTSGTLSRPQ